MEAFTDAFRDIQVTTVFFAILIPLLIYWVATRNHDYWKKRGVPYATPYPFLGSLFENFGKNMQDLECDRYLKLGRIYGFYEASKPQITVAEPELLKNILVKDFPYFINRRKFETGDPIVDKMMTGIQGEDWKRIRSIVSPTFSTGKIKRVMRIFTESAKTVIQNLKMESRKNESVDVLRIYGAFTMDVISSSAFSTKLDSHNDPENIFVRMAKKIFNQEIKLKFVIFMIMPKLMKYFGSSFFDKEVMDFFKKVTVQIIKEREIKGETREDFLQLMLDAAKETAVEEKWDEKSDDITANYGDDTTNHSIFKGSTSKHMSMDELVAQCVIFFIGGYHTTAAALGITTHLLALHQDEQERVFKEISEALSETDGELTYESVQKMKHLDNVISESVRLHSPFIRLERTAEIDYPLGDTGITVPKGMVICIPVYAMHKDSHFFPEPEKFIPDRFTPEGRQKQIPYSYLPFGAGPRNCVGMRFALTELKVCLIHVFSVFNVQLSSESKVPLEFGKGMGLLSPKPIHLKLIPRNNCPLKYE